MKNEIHPIDCIHALGVQLDELRAKVKKTLPYNNGYLTTEQIYLLCIIKREMRKAEEDLQKQQKNETNTGND